MSVLCSITSPQPSGIFLRMKTVMINYNILFNIQVKLTFANFFLSTIFLFILEARTLYIIL